MLGSSVSRLKSLLFRSRVELILRLLLFSVSFPSPILLLFRQESAAEMMRAEMNSSALASLTLLAIISMRTNCRWWLPKTHKSLALYSTKEASRLRSRKLTNWCTSSLSQTSTLVIMLARSLQKKSSVSTRLWPRTLPSIWTRRSSQSFSAELSRRNPWCAKTLR